MTWNFLRRTLVWWCICETQFRQTRQLMELSGAQQLIAANAVTLSRIQINNIAVEPNHLPPSPTLTFPPSVAIIKSGDKNLKMSIFYFRHTRLQSTRVDSVSALRCDVADCVVAGHPPVRHGVRRHSLRRERADHCRSAQLSQQSCV